MAQNCFTFPTATQTNEVTTERQTTTTIVTVSTISSSTSLSTTTSCLPDAPSSGPICGHPTTITLTSTFPATTTTITSSPTITVTFTRTDLVTQYGTSCTQTSSSQVVTPPPFTSSSTSTLPNGSVTYITVTTTPDPYTTTAPLPQNTDDSHSDKPANLGAIIGGTVGGVFGIIAIVLVVWFILKRRRRWDDIFDKDDDAIDGGNRFSLSEDVEPKPYQYGLVGYTPSPSATSPPNSPPLRPTTALSHSHDSSHVAYGGISTISHNTSTGSGQFSSKGTYNNLAPLHMPMTTSIASGISPNSMSTSRPSTAGSMQPLTNRPPSAGHGSVYPPTSHSRNQSFVGHNNAASMSSPPLQPLGWSSMAAATPPPQHRHMNSDDFGQQRSGSPTSFQEPRRQLQIVNQRTSTATWDDGSSVASPVTSTGPSSIAQTSTSGEQRDGKGRLILRNSEPVVQHSDGGRVEPAPQASGSQSAAASGSNSGDNSLPPAYSSLG